MADSSSDLAKALGATVAAVTSARNGSLVQSLGADRVIDYTAERFDAVLRGQDLVFDTIGRESLEKCTGVLTHRGRYVTTIPNAATLRADGEDLSRIASLMSAGIVRSVIDSVYTLSQVRQAHERSRSWRSRGKLVIQVRA